MMHPAPLPILCWQEQESDDDDDDTATTTNMTDVAAAAAGGATKADKKAAPRAALDAMLAGEAAINPQVRTAQRAAAA